MKNIKHLLFLSILCSLALFTNCGDSDDPVAVEEVEEKFTLTVVTSPTEGGSVSYQSGPFTEGTKVTLTATANDNYTFKEWTGAFNGTVNPMELIMNANNSVTAVFEIIDTDGATSDNGAVNNLFGAVFKGSFLQGSLLSFYELDSNLNQTGKSYNATVEDDFGNYTLQAAGLENNIFRVVGDGFYWNEVLNENSESPINLTSICKIDSNEIINVNVLTHLERPRFEYLYSQKGYSFDSAKSEAVSDVLGVFGFKNTGIARAEKVGVTGIGNDSKILLAISTLIQGFRTESEVSELFTKIAEDIKIDGILSDSNIGNDLATHLYYMDTTTMLSNFKTRYATRYASDTINTLNMSFLKKFQDSTDFIKDKELIEFPEFDLAGNKNILNPNNELFTTFFFGVSCVISNKGLNLKVEILNEDGSETKLDDFAFDSQNINWIISTRNNEFGNAILIPTYQSDGIGTYDVKSIFFGSDSSAIDSSAISRKHRLNIYYNENMAPAETRYIDLF
jgi:hypothetical protein